MTTNEEPVMGNKQLIKYLIISILIGGFVLVTAILPAEYNIDPLGTGKLFGFSRLYQDAAEEEIGMQNAPLKFKKLTIEESGSGPDVPVPEKVNEQAPVEQYTKREDNNITVVIPAGKGIEYKFKMLKYGSTKYEWYTDGSILYSDMHGELLLATPPEDEYFESYAEAYSNNMTGTLLAPFEGIHGWYFRNKNKEDVTVNIKLKGQYQLFDIYAKH